MHRLNHLVELARYLGCKIDICVGRLNYISAVKPFWPAPDCMIIDSRVDSKVVGVSFATITGKEKTAIVGVIEETLDKNSNLVYYVGLHEMGHIACKHHVPEHLEFEAQAWDWAFTHALEPMDWETERHFKELWFGSYVNNEDVLLHTAGPMYQMLKNQYGLSPKPKFIPKLDTGLFKLQDWKVEWIPNSSK